MWIWPLYLHVNQKSDDDDDDDEVVTLIDKIKKWSQMFSSGNMIKYLPIISPPPKALYLELCKICVKCFLWLSRTGEEIQEEIDGNQSYDEDDDEDEDDEDDADDGDYDEEEEQVEEKEKKKKKLLPNSVIKVRVLQVTIFLWL